MGRYVPGLRLHRWHGTACQDGVPHFSARQRTFRAAFSGTGGHTSRDTMISGPLRQIAMNELTCSSADHPAKISASRDFARALLASEATSPLSLLNLLSDYGPIGWF